MSGLPLPTLQMYRIGADTRLIRTIAAGWRIFSVLQARYHGLRARCGNKRAIVALAHTLLTIIHAVLKARSLYREAPPCQQTEQQEQRARYHLRCLKKLGYPTLAAE